MLKKITFTEKENGKAAAFHEITFQENDQIFSAYRLKGDTRISALALLPSYTDKWKKRFMHIRTSDVKWSREEKGSSYLSFLDGTHMHSAYEEDQPDSQEWKTLVSMVKETAMLAAPWIFDSTLTRKDPAWNDDRHKAYLTRFHNWYVSLSADSQKEVQKMYPEPLSWKGYWNNEDLSDILWIGRMPMLFFTRDGSYQAETKGTLRFHSLTRDKNVLYFNACEIERKLQKEKKEFLSALDEDKYTEELLSTRYLTDSNHETIWNRSRLTVLINLLMPSFKQDKTAREILLSTGNQKLAYTCSHDELLSESGENLLGKALTMIRKDLADTYAYQNQILIPEKPSAAIKDCQKAADLIKHAWTLSDQEEKADQALKEVHEALKIDPQNGEGWLLAASLSSQISMASHALPAVECGKDIAMAYVYGKEKAGMYQTASETLLAWMLQSMMKSFDFNLSYTDVSVHAFMNPVDDIKEIMQEVMTRTSLYEKPIAFHADKIFADVPSCLKKWTDQLKEKGTSDEDLLKINEIVQQHISQEV